MRRKGFTLVELLGAIILIGLVSTLIAIPILSHINKMSDTLDRAAIKILSNSTEMYLNKYSNTYKKENGNVYYITFEQLVEGDAIDKDFFKSYSEKAISNSTQIKVEVKDNDYEYTILDEDEKFKTIMEIYNSLDKTNTYEYADGTYLKGNQEKNYVLFNGFTWRIMGINEDKTIRLIMDENITSLRSNADHDIDYSTSFSRMWLNDYFISRLQFNNIIKEQKWYYNKPSNASNTVLDDSLFVSDKVGLLSLEEYNLSLLDSASYLKNATTFILLNQKFRLGIISDEVPNLIIAYSGPIFIRPIINVYSNTIVTLGTGVKDNPYVLAEYKPLNEQNTIKNANVTLGSYIKVDDKLYRIVDKDSKKIKIISYHNTGLNSIYAEKDQLFNLSNGAGYILNNTPLSSKFLKENIFLGNFYALEDDYRNTIFIKRNIVYDVTSSLPMIGEFLTTNFYNTTDTVNCYYSLNMSSLNSPFLVCPNQLSTQRVDTEASLIYTAYLSLDNMILSGNGTLKNPYVI